MTPFFFDRGQHLRLPLSLPHVRAAEATPAAFADRMQTLEQEVRALLHTAQSQRKIAMDKGRVDTVFQVGDEVMLRTAELLDAADIGNSAHAGRDPFG